MLCSQLFDVFTCILKNWRIFPLNLAYPNSSTFSHTTISVSKIYGHWLVFGDKTTLDRRVHVSLRASENASYYQSPQNNGPGLCLSSSLTYLQKSFRNYFILNLTLYVWNIPGVVWVNSNRSFILHLMDASIMVGGTPDHPWVTGEEAIMNSAGFELPATTNKRW